MLEALKARNTMRDESLRIISRLQRSEALNVLPGASPQAFTFRALGAERHSFYCFVAFLAAASFSQKYKPSAASMPVPSGVILIGVPFGQPSLRILPPPIDWK